MSENLREVLGKNVKELREIKGLSQRELGKLLNKGNGIISNLENFHSNITLDKLEELSKVLEVEPNRLLCSANVIKPYPEIIQSLINKRPEVPRKYIKLFALLYEEGLRFQECEDYYYLWRFMSSLK